jgi:hypothetical protein
MQRQSWQILVMVATLGLAPLVQLNLSLVKAKLADEKQ